MRISDWSSDVCSSDLFDSSVVGAQQTRLYIAIVVADRPVTDLLEIVAHADIGFLQLGDAVLRDLDASAGVQHRVETTIGEQGKNAEDRHDDQTGRASCRERVCQ